MTINNKQPQPSIPINKIKRFEDFFRLFQEKPTEFKYRDKISKIYAEGENILEFLFEDLNAFDPALAEMLKNNPEDVIPDIIEAFKNLLKFHAPGGKLKDEVEYFIQISTDNDSNLILLRGLRSKHIDKLIFTRGILLRASTVRPKLENAIYKCLRCDTEFPQIQLSNTLIWPNHCVNPKCKANTQRDFIFISKKSDFIDWQKITIQETPEELPAGRIPRSIDGILIKDLVDRVRPGDRIKIMGVFKSLPQKNAKGKGSLIFRTFIDVNSIKSSDKEDLDFYPTPEELKQIKELAAEPYIQRKIARSIASSIYGREDLKLATALCLFGGTRLKKIDGTYRRGDIHVLFVGDPGTGKSEILKAAVNVSPRALYTSGKGSTAVGLTAAVVKDPDTGTMSLEAGAIVLADGGIAAIDEFDKMESQDIAAIHEAMAQQTVSIAKAGIIATLRAQTGIIAAGNPYQGRYNKYKTPTENIRQPPTLLSRFDLIFIVMDEPDKAKDAQLAEFILEQATGDFTKISQNADEPLIPINHDLLKKYIHYARNNCFPVLTQEAKDKIKEYYLDLRGKYDAEQAIVSILARNLEALIRLSESYAKMALRDKVLIEDVEEIIKIFNRFLRDVGYDESTGKFDIDRIFTGQTRSKINKITKILDRIKNMINENDGNAVELENVIEILEMEEDLDREFIEETIDQAVKEGTLYKPRNKYIKFVDNR